MVTQVQKFEDLYETGQNIVQCVQNDEAVKKISSDLEAFQERWKRLVDNMEQQSKQVIAVWFLVWFNKKHTVTLL